MEAIIALLLVISTLTACAGKAPEPEPVVRGARPPAGKRRSVGGGTGIPALSGRDGCL